MKLERPPPQPSARLAVRLTWESWGSASPTKRLFYWLRRDVRGESRGRDQRLVATIRKNRVEVNGIVTRGVSVLLAENMFDPDDPLVVTVNGKTAFEGVP